MAFLVPEESPAVYRIQPLEDPRWGELLERHPGASIFHTAAWLRALLLTYGYPSHVLTTSPPGTPLQNGVVLSSVNSWLTGRRLVSVPSSDHCEPLVTDPLETLALLTGIEQELRREKAQYVDFHSRREIAFPTSLSRSTLPYCFHELDLTPDMETLFAKCHKSSIQRKIRRAEREDLAYESGRSETILETFLTLYALTRRRHRIPPQPRKWFRNLITCFGNDLTIRVAYKNRQPVAATLAIRYKDTLVYKYGCSDVRFNNLGGTPLLFWKMIEESKKLGLTSLDLGRSDLSNPGLITFKDRWGAHQSTLIYSRFALSRHATPVAKAFSPAWKKHLDRLILSHLPDQALFLLGHLLYRHVG